MNEQLEKAEQEKLVAARHAVSLVEDGMKLGLGTGSTALWFVRLLAHRVKEEGLVLDCVPTSSQTSAAATRLGLAVIDLETVGWLDMVVDGADEIAPDMSLIKGGGGALLQEKIVETACDELVVIADPSKEVDMLGAFALPIEVVRFGHLSTLRHITDRLVELGYAAVTPILREKDGEVFVTDEGHYIYDLQLGQIPDPSALAMRLLPIAGVVETGLFLGIASRVIIGHANGDVDMRLLDGTCQRVAVGNQLPSGIEI